MTIYYSKSINGFYSDSVTKSLPSDAVQISDKVHAELLEAQSNGKVIQADKKGNPVALDPQKPSVEQLIAQYEKDAQINLDAVAKSWGYDSLVSAASYSGSSNPQFKAEAEALINWRDNSRETFL